MKHSYKITLTCIALMACILMGCASKKEAVNPDTELPATEAITEINTEAETENKESTEEPTTEKAPDSSVLDNTEADTDASELSVTLVGDSVMLGAQASIESIMPSAIVDAAESRQVSKGVSILETLASQGQLADTVVIALGTNGPFKQAKGQELIDYLGSDRQIYWITTYGSALTWQEDSNSVIRAIADENDNVTVIDWAATASSHPEWFYSDSIHLNGDGRVAYAQLIYDSITQ